LSRLNSQINQNKEILNLKKDNHTQNNNYNNCEKNKKENEVFSQILSSISGIDQDGGASSSVLENHNSNEKREIRKKIQVRLGNFPEQSDDDNSQRPSHSLNNESGYKILKSNSSFFEGSIGSDGFRKNGGALSDWIDRSVLSGDIEEYDDFIDLSDDPDISVSKEIQNYDHFEDFENKSDLHDGNSNPYDASVSAQLDRNILKFSKNNKFFSKPRMKLNGNYKRNKDAEKIENGNSLILSNKF
jgi:hypothetical protein